MKLHNLFPYIFIFAVSAAMAGLFMSHNSNSGSELQKHAAQRFPNIYHKNAHGERVEITDPVLKNYYQVRAFKDTLVQEMAGNDPSFFTRVQNKALQEKPLVVTLSQTMGDDTRLAYVLITKAENCFIELDNAKTIHPGELHHYCVSSDLNPGGWNKSSPMQVKIEAFNGIHNDEQVQMDWTNHISKAAQDIAVEHFLSQK